jgi:hypothetical protein
MISNKKYEDYENEFNLPKIPLNSMKNHLIKHDTFILKCQIIGSIANLNKDAIKVQMIL